MFSKKKTAVAEIDAAQLAADNDTGGRQPGPGLARLLLGVALAWSLFQLWIASPLPFALGIGVFNDTQSRAIHLAFAVFLAYMAFPAFKSSVRDRVPLLDWVFALVGAFCAAYIFIFYRELSTRPGQPTDVDLAVAVTGIAGPGGGSADKPVGTVWLAWAGPQGVQARREQLAGDRAGVRHATVACALRGVLERLHAAQGD